MTGNALSSENAVEAPLRVENAAAVTWDDAADVVVVGFGSAGANSALAANEGGADVLIVDRLAAAVQRDGAAA